MSKTIVFALLLAAVVSLVLIGNSSASSYSVSFTALNSTVGLNQYIFFNVSADFAQNVNYSIYMNSSMVYSGTIPAGSSEYYLIKYNVTNMRYGNYRAYASFSTLKVDVNASNSIMILPKPSLSFENYSNTTAFYNNSAKLDIKLLDSGNTPLNITWALPVFRGISMSIANLEESFSLKAGQEYSIPINMTLSGNYTKSLNFSFMASFNGTSFQKNYYTTLFKPYVNLSFYNTTITKNNQTSSFWTVYLDNKDNTPVMATFEFELYVNGSELYYNKSYLISPSTSSIVIPIPKSTVLGVSVFYLSSNSTVVSQKIFSSPVPGQPSQIVSAIYENISYIVLTVAAITLILLLNRRLSGKKPKSK